MSTTTEAAETAGTAPVSSQLFTGKGLWHRSAPTAVVRAFGWDDSSAGWAVWVEHLSERKKPLVPLATLVARHSPLVWAAMDDLSDEPTAELIRDLYRFCVAKSRRGGTAANSSWTARLQDWLSAVEPGEMVPGYALSCLAWCHALPRLAQCVPAAWWWEIVSHLVQTASESTAADPQENPLSSQLLGGELGLTLAYLLPEINPATRLLTPARRMLNDGLDQLLDGQGLPHASHLSILRPLLACWTRCAALAQIGQRPCWNRSSQNQYEWLVRQALRLTKKDGRQAASPGAPGAWCAELFDRALELGGDEDDRQIAAMALPGSFKSTAGGELPDSVENSEWSEFALLRSSWSRSCDMLAVSYAGGQVELELSTAGDSLIDGIWQAELDWNGKPVRRTAEWEEVCWTADDDVAYLEIEAEYEHGIRIQRQLVLAREDRFALLADAVIGKEAGDLEYRSKLPLACGIGGIQADETREAWLGGKSNRWIVMPLALPEWRCDLRPGSLSTEDSTLGLCQRARGRSLFAPLFIDLNPRRRNKPYTWRQLTVGENRVVQPADVAVGYRIQVASKQWLAYRSLSANRSRTVLGHNLNGDFMLGRFDRSGTVEVIVEIE